MSVLNINIKRQALMGHSGTGFLRLEFLVSSVEPLRWGKLSVLSPHH